MVRGGATRNSHLHSLAAQAGVPGSRAFVRTAPSLPFSNASASRDWPAARTLPVSAQGESGWRPPNNKIDTVLTPQAPEGGVPGKDSLLG